MRPGDAQPILTGVTTALVGFASSFAIVLAGLRAIGADEDQAASGLLVLSVAVGVTSIYLSVRSRLPVTTAWSTPGGALLISAGAVSGGYAAALGAFVFAGALMVLTAFSKRIMAAIVAIPGPLASALLAGVLLPVCVAPAQSLVEYPALTAPVIITWLVLTLTARAWAVPGSLVAAAIAVAIDPLPTDAGAGLSLVLTAPEFNLKALIGLGIPLFVVTMATQNIAGMTVLKGYGFVPPLRRVLGVTGATSAAIAPAGGHAVNLAAITAAMAAAPDSHPDPARRWVATVASGTTMIFLGLAAGAATLLLTASPPVLIRAVAGLALFGALGAALQNATSDESLREPAIVTLVVTVSGITVAGISAPFWALVAGLALLGLQRLRSV